MSVDADFRRFFKEREAYLRARQHQALQNELYLTAARKWHAAQVGSLSQSKRKKIQDAAIKAERRFLKASAKFQEKWGDPELRELTDLEDTVPGDPTQAPWFQKLPESPMRSAKVTNWARQALRQILKAVANGIPQGHGRNEFKDLADYPAPLTVKLLEGLITKKGGDKLRIKMCVWAIIRRYVKQRFYVGVDLEYAENGEDIEYILRVNTLVNSLASSGVGEKITKIIADKRSSFKESKAAAVVTVGWKSKGRGLPLDLVPTIRGYL